MKKKIMLIFLMVLGISLNAQKFAEIWNLAGSNAASWMTTSKYTERNVAAGNGFVYVVSRSGRRDADNLDNKRNTCVKVLDGITGSYIKELYIPKGFVDLTREFCLTDVEVNGNNILACNMSAMYPGHNWILNGEWTFRIHKWTGNDDKNPTELITYSNPNKTRMGGYFTIHGDVEKDATIYVGLYKTNKFAKWTITNGAVVNQTPEIVEFEFRTTNAVFLKNHKFIETSKGGIANVLGAYPAFFNNEGAIVDDVLDATNFPNPYGESSKFVVSIETFKYKDKLYLAALSKESDSPFTVLVKGVCIENGLSAVKASDIFYSDYIGIGHLNENGNGDIATQVIDGKVYVYAMATNSGLVCYRVQEDIEVVRTMPFTDIVEANTGWRKCIADGNKPDWLDSTAMSLAYCVEDDYLYVAKSFGNETPEIIVLKGSTGEIVDITVNVDGLKDNGKVAGGMAIGEINCDSEGNLIASNMVLQGNYQVFVWADLETAPIELINLETKSWQRMSYSFDIKGEVIGDGMFTAVRANSNELYKWKIVNGTFLEPKKITLDIPTDWGAFASVAVEEYSMLSNYWIDAQKMTPSRIKTNGKILDTIPSAVETSDQANRFPSHSSRIKYFKHDGVRFLLSWNSENNQDHTRLIMLTDTISKQGDDSFIEIGQTMGDTKTTYGWGDVDFFFKGDTICIFTLSPDNGIKLDKYVFPSKNPTGILIDNVSSFDKKSVIIYPNPIVEKMNFLTEEKIKTVTIYDIKGTKILYIRKINGAIDLSSLSKGIYFVKIVLRSGKFEIHKIIK